jgi:hypothetical protein
MAVGVKHMTISRNLSILAEGVSAAGVLAVTNGGTGVTTSTGTGSTVLSASPTLTGTLTVPTVTSPSATALTIQSAGTTAMTVDTSQNVGIGTTSPSSFASKLVVVTSDNTNGVIASAATALVRIGGYSSGKSAGYIEALNTAQSAFSPLWFGGSILQFATSGSEAMRIDSSGNLLVGTTSQINGSYNSVLNLKGGNINGIVIQTTAANWNPLTVLTTSGTLCGSISSNNTSISFNATSDYRLKTNVAPINSGLATVAALNPVTYSWISDSSAGEGFIAHELAEIIPHAVTGEKDAVNEDGSIKPQGVDYSKIVVHLVAAIQELSAKNDSLMARVAALEGK